MQKYRATFYGILNRLPLNLLAVCFLFYWLHPGDRLTDSNLAQLRVGMPMSEVILILGPPLTDLGYRVGVTRLTCFGGPFDFESDEEGQNSPGGGLRIGYGIVPNSSWSNTYIIRQVPKGRPSAVKNPDLKVWVDNDRSLWIWSDAKKLVTHLMVLPAEVHEGWREKYDIVKLMYELNGWRGALIAIKEVLAR